MATRSRIGKLNSDGSVTSVYCHWDGYPEHNGVLLQEYYNDPELIDQILELGDLSSLNEKITASSDATHTFDDPQEDVCVFYGRDRNEKNSEAKTTTLEEFYSNKIAEEFNYLYDPETGWITTSQYGGWTKPLKEVLNEK